MDDNFVSIRPYVIPAYYDWLSASGAKPHIVVDIHYPGVSVPSGFDDDGRIVLNIDNEAIRHLEIDDKWIVFQAVFDVDPITVRVPIGAIVLMFAPDTSWYVDFSTDAEPLSSSVQRLKSTQKPQFTILSSQNAHHNHSVHESD